MNQSVNYANHLKAIKNISALPLDLCNIISKYVVDHAINIHFIHAFKYGYLEVVKFLHENGADIFTHGADIFTHGADIFTHGGYSYIFDEICEVIEYGDMKAAITAEFRLACICGHIETVKYIMSSENIDYNVINNSFLSAVSYGHLEVVKFLYENTDVNPIAHDYEAFEIACQSGYFDIVKYLFEAYPNYYMECRGAVNSAARNGHLNTVKFLHENGLEISEASYRGALLNGHNHVLDYLMQNGVNTALI
jgi:ankyrin repeat protein